MGHIIAQVLRYYESALWDNHEVPQEDIATLVLACAIIQLSSEVVVAKTEITPELEGIGRAIDNVDSRLSGIKNFM